MLRCPALLPFTLLCLISSSFFFSHFTFFNNIPLLHHLLNVSLLFFAIADRRSRFLNISATTATFTICLFEFPEMQFEVSWFTCSRFPSYPEFVGHAWIRWCWSLRLLRRQLWLRTPLPLLVPLLPPYVSLFPYIYCDRSGCSETLLWRAEEGLSLLSKSLLIVFCFLIVLILFAFIVCKLICSYVSLFLLFTAIVSISSLISLVGVKFVALTFRCSLNLREFIDRVRNFHYLLALFFIDVEEPLKWSRCRRTLRHVTLIHVNLALFSLHVEEHHGMLLRSRVAVDAPQDDRVRHEGRLCLALQHPRHPGAHLRSV